MELPDVTIQETPGVAVELDPGTQAEAGKDELGELRASVAEANQKADAAAARATQADKERNDAVARARVEVNSRVQAQEVALDSSIAAFGTELAALRKDYTEALTGGSYDKAAEINEKIAGAVHDMRAVEGRKSALTQAKEAAIKQAAERPAEAADLLAVFSAPTKAWLQAHPDAQPGKALWKRAKAFSDIAEESGIKADTPEYFAFIEKNLGMGTETVETAQTARRESTTTAAPPQRGNGNGAPRTSGKRTLQLTAGQAEVADRMSILGKTVDERRANYAKNLIDSVKRGDIDESQLHWAN